MILPLVLAAVTLGVLAFLDDFFWQDGELVLVRDWNKSTDGTVVDGVL